MPGEMAIPDLVGVRVADVMVVVAVFTVIVVVVGSKNPFMIVVVVGITAERADVVIDLDDSAGLKRLNGLGIAIPGKMVIPNFIGLGLGVAVDVVANATVVVMGTSFTTDDAGILFMIVIRTSFATVLMKTSFAMVVVRPSFVVVIIVGATAGVVMVMVSLGGSTGLNKSSGFEILMPGRMVHPEPLVKVGLVLYDVVVVVGEGLNDSVVTTMSSSAVVVSDLGLVEIVEEEGHRYRTLR